MVCQGMARRSVKPAPGSYLEAEAVLRRSTKYLLEVDTKVQVMVVKRDKLDQVLYGLERVHKEMTLLHGYTTHTVLKITVNSAA